MGMKVREVKIREYVLICLYYPGYINLITGIYFSFIFFYYFLFSFSNFLSFINLLAHYYVPIK